MVIYTFITVLVGIIGGILIAVRSKRAEGVVYGKLDKAGRATNLFLAVVYVLTAPAYLFIGIISEPGGEGLLFIPSLIVSAITASTAIFCGFGLGFSVALRKKGKSKMSFAAQFAGIVGIAITVIFYAVFAGNLISSLN